MTDKEQGWSWKLTVPVHLQSVLCPEEFDKLVKAELRAHGIDPDAPCVIPRREDLLKPLAPYTSGLHPLFSNKGFPQ